VSLVTVPSAECRTSFDRSQSALEFPVVVETHTILVVEYARWSVE